MTPCEIFREHAEELALGGPVTAQRDELLAHAATCAACQTHLDGLTQVTDRLLLTVTEIEPPEGFEARVLARLGLADAPSNLGRGRQHRPVRRAVAAAAAFVLLVGSGLAVGRALRPSTNSVTAASVTRAGAIVRKDGTTAGLAQLVRDPAPHVLVTIEHPQPNPGRVSCRLVLADGSSFVVGTWGYDDVQAGVWAVGIDAPLLTAQRMDVLDSAGAVIASALLH